MLVKPKFPIVKTQVIFEVVFFQVAVKYSQHSFIHFVLEITRSACESRGCVWRSTTSPGVPTCFYASDDVHGYDVVDDATPNQ